MMMAAIFKKEFISFFYSRLAYAVIGIYLILSMIVTFFGGNYFQIMNNSLTSFFFYQPEIFLFIAPALTMRLWADERRYGTLELILTQPVGRLSIVIGKFLSAWGFCILMLLLTTPLWITTAMLVNVDNLHILSNYTGCILSSGLLCSVGCAVSAFCSGPVSAYIISIFVCAIIKLVNFDYIFRILGMDGELMQRISHSLNFDYQYNEFLLGQPGVGNVMFFLFFIIIALWFNLTAVDYKRG